MSKSYWLENQPFTGNSENFRSMLSNTDLAAKMLKDFPGIFIINKGEGRDTLDLAVIIDGEIDSRDLVKSYEEYLLKEKSEEEVSDITGDLFDNIRIQGGFWKWVEEKYGDGINWVSYHEPGTKI